MNRSGLRRLIDLGVPHWAASLVCLLMIVAYLRHAECAGPDPDAAYLAVAWGIMFGVSLCAAFTRTRRRLHMRKEPGASPTANGR